MILEKECSDTDRFVGIPDSKEKALAVQVVCLVEKMYRSEEANNKSLLRLLRSIERQVRVAADALEFGGEDFSQG